jgi:uncharacterized protein YfbU (UPF0304 family)
MTTERRILANQYRILAALHEDEREAYEAKAEALEWGYAAHFDDSWFTQDEDVLSVEACHEVTDILSMYDDLLMSYERLEDKDGIEAHRVGFPGLDGNNESWQMGYAKYFCERFEGGNRFETIRAAPGFAYNSHARMLPLYRAMLREYEPVRREKRGSGGWQPLSKADIQRVLAARP